MLVLEGMPILLIELGIGQRLRAGCFGVWNIIHPNLGGIGLGSAVVAIVVGCYYNVIIAWCLYYLINSFRVSRNRQIFSECSCSTVEVIAILSYLCLLIESGYTSLGRMPNFGT